MIPAAITMTVLTHPLQGLLIGMILSRLVREGVAQARQTWQARRPGTGSHRAPAAGPPHLWAALATGDRPCT
jgi:hypothetical protein